MFYDDVITYLDKCPLERLHAYSLDLQLTGKKHLHRIRPLKKVHEQNIYTLD